MATVGPKQIDMVWTGHLFAPPAYTRLEPQSVTGDPTPGVAAAVHDPLWSLFRQWQTGEFAGEDAGTPLAVRMVARSERLTRFAHGAPADGAPMAGQDLPDGAALDRLVEGEPTAASGPGLRARAEAGQVLVAALVEAGFDDAGAVLAGDHPFAPVPGLTPVLAALIAVLPDAEQVAKALEAGQANWATGPGRVAPAAADWLDWYRRNVSPVAAGSSWLPKRLEYRFAVATDAGRSFVAPMHLGGDIDWYSFDHAPDGTVAPLQGRPAAADVTETKTTTLTAPLRFPGMPADRFWEFEDARVNLPAMNVQPNDPARLAVIEFATVHGGDWFTAALDVPGSSFTTVEPLVVTDSFGEQFEVPRAPPGPFRLFETSDGADSLPGLLLVGGARGTMEGAPIESVLFLRDEGANMVWGVEHLVEDAAGLPRSRRDEAPTPTAPLAPLPGTDLRYTLETAVPRHWIPFVPVRDTTADHGFVLRKGTLSGDDDSVGRILAGKPYDIHDEEVPRGGIRVSRVPSMARDAAQRPLRWTAYRLGEGAGELASGYQSDVTTDVR